MTDESPAGTELRIVLEPPYDERIEQAAQRQGIPKADLIAHYIREGLHFDPDAEAVPDAPATRSEHYDVEEYAFQ